jgi:hypothetical protein
MSSHIEYKMTAQKLAVSRLRTSQIASSKNSQCLSLNSFEDSVENILPQGAQTTHNNAGSLGEELFITTIDK